MRISDWSSDLCSSDLTYLFFTASANGRRAAKAFLARLKERKADRDATVSITAFRRQLTAIQAWGKQAPQNLGAIHQPVLVANGDHDIMAPSTKSIALDRRLPTRKGVV